MIAALALLSTAAAQWSWFFVPTSGYDTDDKLGFGTRLELNRAAEGLEPYQTGIMVQAYATTSGYHNHQLRYDRLGINDLWRLTVNLAWRVWGNDGYWGIGNGTLRVADADRRRYRYTLAQPSSHTTLQRPLSDRLSLFVGLRAQWSRVTADPQSLLAEQQP